MNNVYYDDDGIPTVGDEETSVVYVMIIILRLVIIIFELKRALKEVAIIRKPPQISAK